MVKHRGYLSGGVRRFFCHPRGVARWLPLALAYDQSFDSGLAPSFTLIQYRRTAQERFSDAAVSLKKIVAWPRNPQCGSEPHPKRYGAQLLPRDTFSEEQVRWCLSQHGFDVDRVAPQVRTG